MKVEPNGDKPAEETRIADTEAGDSYDFSLDLPGTHPEASGTPAIPAKIAEFEIRVKLGQGGFGTVFSAYDTMLQRQVAIKIPHLFVTQGAAGTAAYLREARAVASLDHPNILPVYQAATTPEVAFYIVTKLIEGTTLGEWARQSQPTFSQLAMMIAKIADALGYAHLRGVIHRDVKPGNILVDCEGRPYVADFGLAIREIDLDRGPAYVGTPSYMSPEQARGEGHRVDGRSDIFSLGIVFYQLLVGNRPFQGSDQRRTLSAIESAAPEHPCRCNPAIPKELARICLRALSKSMAERYQCAEDMAVDLHEFLKSQDSRTQAAKSVSRLLAEAGSNAETAKPRTDSATVGDAAGSTAQISPIVPKGLRPFESGDADFFLRLLPGPYDRQGLPSAIRFWKTRIESRHPQEAFSVGVIYGPSGCGKTSMFRAGLMPRLAESVIPVYVEASATDSERAILDAISSVIEIPARSGDVALADAASHDLPLAFAWLRRNSPRKVVICIDQFEQWLFSHSSALEQSALTQALRQCDGVHLQCLLMVRDDFWMGITRLMQALDLTISEHHNASAVDLFDTRHARHVLAMFGNAFGQLPADEELLSPRQNRFLDAATEYLAVDGRIICVQLALLAEMMKHREWTDSELLSKDGGAGLGVRFLEQTFDRDASPRRFRRHTEGAQRLLRRLLPEPGAKIKGAIRSESELQEASGYTDTAAFRELLRILDSELHLVTPTDRNDGESFTTSGLSASRPGSVSSSTAALSVTELSATETGYQLTHDFLIAPVRRWLELRQLGTPVGQAQLKLENFTDLYRARPGHHSLPGLTEYLSIRFRLRPSAWNEPQQRMMKAAKDRHIRSVGQQVLLLIGILVIAGMAWALIARQQKQQLARAAVDRILDATLPEAIVQADDLRRGNPEVLRSLKSELAREDSPVPRRIRAALVLAATDSSARDLLLDYLQQAPAHEVVPLCKSPLLQELADLGTSTALWHATQDDPSRQLRLACLLAQQTTTHPLLMQHAERVVQLLLRENPLMVSEWMDGFEPVGGQLLPFLVTAYEEITADTGSAALNAANMIARYAKNQPDLLAGLTSRSAPTGHRVFVSALKASDTGVQALERALNETRTPSTVDQFWQPDADGNDWWNDVSQTRNPPELRIHDDAELNGLIRNAGGIADDWFVLVQSLDAAAVEPLAAQLEPFGYRVASTCPYPTHDGLKCMATWKRDGRQSVYTIRSTADELRQLQNDWQNQQYFAEDLTAYSLDEYQTMLFACVWTTTPPLPVVEESGMYVDVPASDHESRGWRSFTDRAFIPRSNVLTMDRNGDERFSSIRWMLKEGVRFHDNWNQNLDWFERTRDWSDSSTLMQSRLGVRSPGHPDRGLTVLWWNGLPIDSKWLPYQPGEDHRRECDSVRAQGFRPFGIHATRGASDDTPLFSSTWWRPMEHVAARSESIRRQTRLSLALHELGRSGEVITAMSSPVAAELRSAAIDNFSRYESSPMWLAEQLYSAENSAALRRAAALALALYQPGTHTESIRAMWSERSNSSLAAVDDAGLKSAVLALGAAWNMPMPLSPERLPVNEFLTKLGQRMVVLDPPDIQWIGSPANEPGRDGGQEIRFPVSLDHRFAISTHEVTIGEFIRFRESADCPQDYCPTADCPMITINWFDAARYCRWLSDVEKLEESEMCYPEIDSIKPGMSLAYDCLNRTGYRLPTEAEWEFAARGGYDDGRHFGFAPELLDQYAWTARNSEYRCHPVGTRLPNDFGLFDMLGNAMEWCHDRHQPHPWPSSGAEPDPAVTSLSVGQQDQMATRGGAVLFQPLDARAAHRNDHAAGENRVYLSFRIARTVRDR